MSLEALFSSGDRWLSKPSPLPMRIMCLFFSLFYQFQLLVLPFLSLLFVSGIGSQVRKEPTKSYQEYIKSLGLIMVSVYLKSREIVGL